MGSVFKFMVPSLFQYFIESLENGVCEYLCQSVKNKKLGSKATVSRSYLILKLLLINLKRYTSDVVK